MVRVFADGDGRHRLEDLAGRHIGWVRHPLIGFQGFRSERDAVIAAEAAWRALETVLRRTYIGRPPSSLVPGTTAIARDGDTEWVSGGRTILARLRRPARDGSRTASFGIEFELPSYAHEGVSIAAAHVMAAVVQENLWLLERSPADAEAGAASSVL